MAALRPSGRRPHSGCASGLQCPESTLGRRLRSTSPPPVPITDYHGVSPGTGCHRRALTLPPWGPLAPTPGRRWHRFRLLRQFGLQPHGRFDAFLDFLHFYMRCALNGRRGARHELAKLNPERGRLVPRVGRLDGAAVGRSSVSVRLMVLGWIGSGPGGIADAQDRYAAGMGLVDEHQVAVEPDQDREVPDSDGPGQRQRYRPGGSPRGCRRSAHLQEDAAWPSTGTDLGSGFRRQATYPVGFPRTCETQGLSRVARRTRSTESPCSTTRCGPAYGTLLSCLQDPVGARDLPGQADPAESQARRFDHRQWSGRRCSPARLRL
jgi:hypothetical protein